MKNYLLLGMCLLFARGASAWGQKGPYVSFPRLQWIA